MYQSTSWSVCENNIKCDRFCNVIEENDKKWRDWEICQICQIISIWEDIQYRHSMGWFILTYVAYRSIITDHQLRQTAKTYTIPTFIVHFSPYRIYDDYFRFNYRHVRAIGNSVNFDRWPIIFWWLVDTCRFLILADSDMSEAHVWLNTITFHRKIIKILSKSGKVT